MPGANHGHRIELNVHGTSAALLLKAEFCGAAQIVRYVPIGDQVRIRR
jgi:hypothetical protein